MPHDPQAIRTLLWHRELEIYQARGRGDLNVYAGGIAPTYLAWPPQSPGPINAESFAGEVKRFAATGAELLTMNLTDFTLDGDTAIIFYQTHRTRLPDGTPTDQRYEVIHVWIYRAATWLLLSGMARLAPARPT